MGTDTQLNAEQVLLLSKFFSPEEVDDIVEFENAPINVLIKAMELERRLEELEDIIMMDPECIYWYCVYIIDGEWPEAEPVILKDEKWGKLYKERIVNSKPRHYKDFTKSDVLSGDIIDEYFEEPVNIPSLVDIFKESDQKGYKVASVVYDLSFIPDSDGKGKLPPKYEELFYSDEEYLSYYDDEIDMSV